MAIQAEDLDLGDIVKADVDKSIDRIRRLSDKFYEAQRKIKNGLGHEAESPERRIKEQLRSQELADQQSKDDPLLFLNPGFGLEANIGKRNNILSGEFLEIGSLTARAVCKITYRLKTGTGFLVGNGIVLTNHHVLMTKNQADDAIFEFHYDENKIGDAPDTSFFVADTSKFFYADKDLDLCFVALREMQDLPPISSYGWLPLKRGEGKILLGDPVNIIQHPLGQRKRLVVHDSNFTFVDNDSEDDAFCWYTGDTEKGSSGSPVMNSNWEVVALHHMAVPATDKNGNVLDIKGKTIASSRANDEDTRVKWIANEGIRVSRIVTKLENAAFDSADYEKARDELIANWEMPLAVRMARLAGYNGKKKADRN